MSVCVLVAFVYDLLADLTWITTSHPLYELMLTVVFFRKHKENGKHKKRDISSKRQPSEQIRAFPFRL